MAKLVFESIAKAVSIQVVPVFHRLVDVSSVSSVKYATSHSLREGYPSADALKISAKSGFWSESSMMCLAASRRVA